MKTTYNNDERLAVLETKVDEVNDKITEILAEMKAVTRGMNNREAEIIGLKAEVKRLELTTEELKKKTNIWKWLSPTLSAAVTAVIVFLLIEYLSTIRG